MKQLLFLLIILPQIILCQSTSGYYMNWDRDHTGRTVKPMIPISEEEAQTINCYWVEFNEENRFKRVRYYNTGQASERSNYGAHELVRNYYSDRFEDTFRDITGEPTLNSSGVKKYLRQLNPEGYWVKIENHNEEEELVEENGVTVIKVVRDYQNRILTEIHLNLKKDTIPDPNGFKVVHFTYNKDSYMTARINIDVDEKLQHGKDGYATVVFQYDQNGMFFGEEFLNTSGDLVIHPNLGYAKIDFREFNKYGKNTKQYFMDENGYPSTGKAMAVIEYNTNMSRNNVLYYDRIGERTEDFKGVASIAYEYDKNGSFLRRKYYNLKNELLE